MDEPNEFTLWLAEQLEPWHRGCPRCDWLVAWMVDGRCAMCGMDPREEGPAPRRLLRGLSALR